MYVSVFTRILSQTRFILRTAGDRVPRSRPSYRGFVSSPPTPVTLVKSDAVKVLKVSNISYSPYKSVLFSLVHRLKKTFSFSVMEEEISLKPPSSVRGMMKLDEAAFKSTVTVPGWYVPVNAVRKVSYFVKKVFLKQPCIKPVADLADNDPRKSTFKLFLFDPKKFKAIDENVKELVAKHGVKVSDPEQCQINLSFENWNFEQILDAILPEDTDGVAHFSVIGHIVHLNLKRNLLPYKLIIGEVILKKVAKAETVINKLDIIDNTYRNFEFELLAGKPNYVTISRENGFNFELDFSKVYWNPRLATEHERIVSKLKREDTLFDVFAGIGPFAVPAAKKGCKVHANDLNPESHKWLQANMKRNKVTGEHYEYNMDGRDFIRTVIKSKLTEHWQDNEAEGNIHIVMNLPAIAPEFLDSFNGLFAGETVRPGVTPIVHCHCFCRGDNVTQDAVELAETYLGHPLPEIGREIVVVRSVAPGKEMMRVSFHLTDEILFNTDSAEPPGKKLKTSNANTLLEY